MAKHEEVVEENDKEEEDDDDDDEEKEEMKPKKDAGSLLSQIMGMGVKMQVEGSGIQKIKDYELQQIQGTEVAKLRDRARQPEDHIEALIREQLADADEVRGEFLEMFLRFKGSLATKEKKQLDADLENRVPAEAKPKEGVNLYGFGENRHGKCGLGNVSNFIHTPTGVAGKFKTVECGFHHAMAIDHSNVAHSWGKNQYGQLGQGRDDDDCQQRLNTYPNLVRGVLLKVKLRAVACGFQHSMALTPSGFVYSWGLNIYGQLGVGDFVDRPEPALIKSIADIQVVQISAGYLHSGAVGEQGSLFMWGHNPDGRLIKKAERYRRSYNNDTQETRSYSIPQYCAALKEKHVVEVSCGSTHTLVIDDSGCVQAGGNPEWGQLGVAPNKFKASELPYVCIRPFSTAQPAVKVRAGDGFSVALDLNGHVWICGKGNFGRQGTGSIESNERMTKIEWFAKKKIKIADIEAGGRHSLAISQADRRSNKKPQLYGWGFNFYNQLGQGEEGRVDCLVPAKIELPSKATVKKASCGYFNSAALTK